MEALKGFWNRFIEFVFEMFDLIGDLEDDSFNKDIK